MAGRGRLIQTNFSGGELSKAARGRPDTNVWSGGLEINRNCVTRPAGASDRRGGAAYLGDAKAGAGDKKWFVLRKGINDIVRIEAGAYRFRFWDGMTRQLITSGGSPVEVVIPWSNGELQGLRCSQQGDVLWFSHVGHGYPTKALKRTSPTSFSLVDVDYLEGPFKTLQSNAPLLTFGASSGSGVSCGAASSLFSADMVGSLIRVEATTMPDVASWTFDVPTELGDYCRNGNRIYECTDRGDPFKTGNSPPVHEAGAYWDGTFRDNIQWTFRGYTYGLAEITGYTSPTSVTVKILQRLPFYGAASKTSDVYYLGALSDAEGWPAATTIFEDRFCAFGSATDPARCFLGRTELYTPETADMRPGFATETLDTDAVRRSLAEGETAHIVWAMVMDGLLLGTTVGVRQLTGPSADEGITPAGAVPRTVTEIPCSPDLPGIKADNALIYSAVGNQELIEVSRQRDAIPRNLLELAEHLTDGGIQSYCWQGRPARILWVVTDRGRLRSLTYSPENDTYAWAPHPLGGSYEGREPWVDDVCSAPGPDGRDEVWLIVARTVNGATLRTVEYITRRFDQHVMRVEDACCLDAAAYVDLWQGYTAYVEDLGEGRVQLSAGSGPFVAGDVDREFWLTGNGSTYDRADEKMPVRVSIDTVVSATIAEASLIGGYDESLWKNRTLRIARPTRSIGALDWLEGEEVMVNADGRAFGPFTVASGVITLTDSAGGDVWMARGWIGLAYESLRRSLPVNGGEGLGSSLGAMGRISGLTVLTDGVAEGRVKLVDQPDDYAIPLNWQFAEDPLGQAPDAESNDRWLDLETGYDRDKQIEVIADGPLPCSLTGFVLKVESYG